MPKPLVGFILRFVAGWVAVLALLASFPAIEQLAVRHTVASLGGAARLLGLSFESAGAWVQIARAGMSIVPDCTPLMPFATFAIAVIAFPAAWRWRLAGLAAGAVALWLYNVLRILALVPVLLWRPGWFDFIHLYLWQTVTLVVVFALFLVWLKLQGGPTRVAPAAGPGPRPATVPAP